MSHTVGQRLVKWPPGVARHHDRFIVLVILGYLIADFLQRRNPRRNFLIECDDIDAISAGNGLRRERLIGCQREGGLGKVRANLQIFRAFFAVKRSRNRRSNAIGHGNTVGLRQRFEILPRHRLHHK